MKGDKNNRRKSTNNISDKNGKDVIYKGHHRDANDSTRIVGLPYEPQHVGRSKKDRSTKHTTNGTLNFHGSEKSKDVKHGARHSSNHPRDRFVVPSIWQDKDKSGKHRGARHGADRVDSGGGRIGASTGAKTGSHVLKATKKSKHQLFEGHSSQRLDAMTPHIAQRNSAE